ncbi:MAG: metallophosphoesterase family protein [Erysipelotrichales bacterium]|nr:metallophosphoesterase family protein [Erysipelotrichales bacterium]
MKDLIIGDCHFGIKSNSIQWLETQLDFFKKQIIPELERNNYNRVIFLGDIFDIRYAVNQYIGYEVKSLFRDLTSKFNNVAFYIVAGNHDYYSPDINYSKYNAYNLIFGYEFLSIHPNLHIIQNDYLIEDDTVFAPWYWTENIESFNKMIEDINNIDGNKPSLMYCHTDLATWPIDGRLDLKPKDMTIISGHIHNIQKDEKNRLFNVGSMFAINFNDVNTKKYFYSYDTIEKKFLEAFENITTPKFIQFSNEDIFTLKNEDVENSHVRIFINSDNINKASYIERLTEIKKNFEYKSLKIQTINTNIIENVEGVNINTNITDFIEQNIPEHLKNKYNFIKDKVKEEN